MKISVLLRRHAGRGWSCLVFWQLFRSPEHGGRWIELISTTHKQARNVLHTYASFGSRRLRPAGLPIYIVVHVLHHEETIADASECTQT